MAGDELKKDKKEKKDKKVSNWFYSLTSFGHARACFEWNGQEHHPETALAG